MARYPLSHNAGKKHAAYFEQILSFHVPPSLDKRILDPTCGKRHLWDNFFIETLVGKRKIEQYGEVVFSDVVDFGYNKVQSIDELDYSSEFDCIVYDPPYFFGYKSSDDPRRKDYGDYDQSYESLLWFMDTANEIFPDVLKENGKVILECADL